MALTSAKNRGRGGRSSERPPRQIFPISVKYGVVSGLILLAFVIGVSSSLTQSSLDSTTRLLQQNGLELVKLAHTFVDPFWTRTEMPVEARAASQLPASRHEAVLLPASACPSKNTDGNMKLMTSGTKSAACITS